MAKTLIGNNKQVKGPGVELQQMFNIAVALSGFLGGWWVKTIWESLKDLQKVDKELAEKVSTIEVLVAGQYIKRDEVKDLFEAVFRKLDKIDDKLNEKADK